MLKDYVKKKVDSFNKKTQGNNKRNIENLVVFLILLIITIIAINTIWKEEPNQDESSTIDYKQLVLNNDNSNTFTDDTYNLEQRLEDILTRIDGVGAVKVLITYSETSEVVAMYNESYVSSTTEEEDTNGGVRTINQTDTQKEIVFEDKNR